MEADPLIGAELGDFRPERVLGRGGMGVVYEAQDLALPRKVALKVLAPEVAEEVAARGRFQREIDHAVSTEHPHVVPVYSAGFERPHFYIAMRLVPGEDLASVIRRNGPLQEERTLRLLGQIASALDAVHRRGLVHRDVKPHNVLVWGEGRHDEHAFLTDFGIAKALDDSRQTTTLGPIGTPAYMAPEVCLARPASPASDQYSLACMAFEMLTGRRVFEHDDMMQLRVAQVEEDPTDAVRAAAEMSSPVRNALSKALSKEPSSRFDDLHAFVCSADAAGDAFHRSQEVSRVIAESKPAEAVGVLSSNHGLTDGTISHLTDMDRTEVVRLRRRRARLALVGRRNA